MQTTFKKLTYDPPWRQRWRRTLGSLCHAVISQPAAVSRSSHVAHHLSVQALRGGGAGAGGRTDGTLGHTEVSQPTVSVRPHVTAGWGQRWKYLVLLGVTWCQSRHTRRASEARTRRMPGRWRRREPAQLSSLEYLLDIDWLSLLASWLKYSLITVRKCVRRPHRIKKLLLFHCPEED